MSMIEKKQTNTAEIVANTLRKEIIQGRYKANQPLRQDRIAEELGVSKIPLREALVQLKTEGLVSFMPKRGAVVSGLSTDEVEEIYTMRLALESAAMEKSIPNLSDSDFIRAKSVLEIIDIEKDKRRWGDLNWEFHSILYQAARMPLLLNTIQHLHNNVARYLIIYLDRLSASDLSQKEHRAILEACRHNKIADAKQLINIHLTHASERLIAYLA